MTEPTPTAIAQQIAREVLWAPLAVILLHWLLGDWFGHEPYVDPVMHFCGGVAAAYFFWESSVRSRRYLGDLAPPALAMLSFGMASAAAVGWEFAEFLVDQVTGSNIQRGLANTMRDLGLGLAGGLLFALVWMGLNRGK